jgi:hypothetical protein
MAGSNDGTPGEQLQAAAQLCDLLTPYRVQPALGLSSFGPRGRYLMYSILRSAQSDVWFAIQ